MKPCFKCGQVKPLSEFYKHSQMKDGHLNKCKECTKKDVQKNYRNHIDSYKEYERKRANLPHRVEARKKYSKTEAYAVAISKSRKNYRKKYPEKYKANTAVGSALKNGSLVKKPCQICGSTEKIEAHHPDYSKPLDIRWLCSACHHKWHKDMRMNEENKKSLLKLFEDQKKLAEQLQESDDPTALVEQMNSAIRVKVGGIAFYCESLDALINGVDETIKKLQQRKKVLQNRKDSLKNYTLMAMQANGISKIETPEYTVTVQKNPYKVEIDDERMIPAEFWVYPPAPAPYVDKEKVKKAYLDDGEVVQGTRVVQSEGLRIR